MQSRDENTDLIRALAIALVLVHHIGQFQDTLPSIFIQYFSLGAYGVDLFFVLSGWLIGGLYWREHKTFGQIHIKRFWARRCLRTLPPYFVVLPIAFLSVWLYRRETFDFGYLLFMQNYYSEVPFFLISWSLAVEEHFYFALPLVLAAILSIKIKPNIGLLILILISMSARLIDPNATPSSSGFGYAVTASHLNMTGLLIGVYLAYSAELKPNYFKALSGLAKKFVAPALLLIISMPFWNKSFQYYIGDTVIALIWAMLLLALISSPTQSLAKSRFIKKLALWSYSIYLTHAMVINVGVLAADKLDLPRWIFVPIWLIFIFIVGGTLYKVVERPAIQYRDKIAPRRKHAQKS